MNFQQEEDEIEDEIRKQVKIDDFSQFDEQHLRQLLSQLDKHEQINQQLRSKYADQPEKFVESEIDLDEDIKALQELSLYPELFHIFIEQTGTMIALMQHPNTDIVIEVLKFFNELIKDQSDAKIVLRLFDALVDNLFLESLIECIEIDAWTTFEIIESMIELRASISEQLGRRTKILSILLTKVEDDSEAVDDIRLYASELLVQIIQSSEHNRLQLININAIENLLVVFNRYRKQDPETAEEKEIVNNGIQVLTLLLLHPEGKQSFEQLEGVQLCLKLVQAKKYISLKAFKILDTALTKTSSDLLIQNQGLSLIFPILMGKGLHHVDQSITLNIIKTLLRYAHEKHRVIDKCIEKLSTIQSLRSHFIEKVPLLDPEEYDQLPEEKLEDVYLDLLDQGLFPVETCDIILLEIKKAAPQIQLPIEEQLASLRQMLQFMDPSESKTYYEELLQYFK